MKKHLFKTMSLSTSILTLGSAIMPSVGVLASEHNISNIVAYSDDDYYYVLDESTIQTRTWSKPQNWSIKKGTRTYLGVETHTRGTKLSISANIFGMKIELNRTTSASGKFKKYRQNATITVTYKVYRKVDNRYVRTETATANTQYIDYIPIG
ncbi:hypothetical protein EFL14_RS11215 [Enterococcus hirae]|uniref:LMxysn_1693 family intestinal colonization protein n=1 Tax=Enterococcus sp. C63 TaxID=3231324 RepID=UPI0019E2ED03|nr:hypothetical protein [Enterococcus hirae]EMF0449400.1 hypothetical protein [Enterococcus hirae]EMF0515309.1 hypothetical protein [Enterococcus hirae]EMF0520207.1 hypothetical protein [Enterococcus hirae]